MLAGRDLNANGEVEAGDELAVVVKDGQPQLVTPPASRLELRLQVFTGDLGALLSQAQPATAVAPPSPPSSPAANDARAPVGIWGTTRSSPADLVGPSGSSVVGGGSAISYEFKSDGRYTYAGLLEMNGPVLFLKDVVYDEGKYTVKNDLLTLQFRRRQGSWNGRKLQSDTTSNGTETYRWSISPASSNDGTLALYLIDQVGTKLEYPFGPVTTRGHFLSAGFQALVPAFGRVRNQIMAAISAMLAMARTTARGRLKNAPRS